MSFSFLFYHIVNKVTERSRSDRTTDNGQRTTDNGQRTTDNGQRTTDNGQRRTNNRQQTSKIPNNSFPCLGFIEL
ncbi:hypothetical protein VBZ51_09430 [Maribacter sp. HS]|uniref:hypothetical protein n=1 Tax=Maribacter sp. HS TaxID=3110480 RepID=UPI003A87E84B